MVLVTEGGCRTPQTAAGGARHVRVGTRRRPAPRSVMQLLPRATRRQRPLARGVREMWRAWQASLARGCFPEEHHGARFVHNPLDTRTALPSVHKAPALTTLFTCWSSGTLSVHGTAWQTHFRASAKNGAWCTAPPHGLCPQGQRFRCVYFTSHTASGATPWQTMESMSASS